MKRIFKGSLFLIILGWLSAGISLFIKPVFFGILGIAMGSILLKKTSKGLNIIVASIAFSIAGYFLHRILSSFLYSYLKVMTILY
mgnify:FL=1